MPKQAYSFAGAKPYDSQADLTAGLSLRALGKRLGRDKSTLAKWAARSPDEFANYTQPLDPEKFAWEGRSDGKFYPRSDGV